MSRSQRAQWWNTAAVVGAGVLLACVLLLLGLPGWAVGVLIVAGLCAILAAPRHAPHEPRHWEAQERLVRDGRLIVYWRPGCLRCAVLRLRLGPRAAGATWVDIWSDPEAAAFVRDVNGGAEVVPTVILPDGEARTNPDAAEVRRYLDDVAEAA